MKNKGVITAIILILILGVGITIGTRHYIAGQQEGSLIQAAASDDEDEADSLAKAGSGEGAGSKEGAGRESQAGSGIQGQDTFPAENTETGIGSDAGEKGLSGKYRAQSGAGLSKENSAFSGGTAEEAPAQGRMAAGEEADGPEEAESETAAAPESIMEEAADAKYALAADESPISPLTGGSSPGADAADEAKTQEDYRKRLEEIDTLVANMKGSDVLSNTDSMSNIADYEYRLWDEELNQIYQAVLNAITPEGEETLRSEERAWLKERDQMANQAASKYKGGTMERLEYTASLAALTRERAYGLLEEYGPYLTESDGE